MRHTNRTVLLKWLLVILSSFNFMSASAENTIKIGTIDLSPWGIRPSQGVYYDLANRIATEAGFSYRNQITPLKRLLRMLSSGDIDLCILFSHKAVDQYSHREVALLELENVFLSLKGVNFNDLNALSGTTTGFIRGAPFSENIEKILNLKVYRVNSYHQGIKMLLAGRIDTLAGERTSLFRSARETFGVRKINFDRHLHLEKRTVWLYLSKQLSVSTKEKLNEAAIELRDTGYIHQLMQLYGEEY